MIPRIHTLAPLTPNTTITIDGQSAKHLLKVLRLQTDDPIELFDGQGHLATAHIQQPHKHQVEVLTSETVLFQPAPGLALHLYAALCQRQRFDWMLQKTTELGVASITPLVTQRTQSKIAPTRLDKRQQHWQSILISAAEQSGNLWLPALHAPVKLADALQAAPVLPGVFTSLHADQALRDHTKPEAALSIWVGPESGWHTQEETELVNAHLTPISLGALTLRAETASVAAVASCQALWGK